MPKSNKLTKPQIRKRKRILLENMHYHQMLGRMDRKAVKADDANVRYYAEELRKLQQEDKA